MAAINLEKLLVLQERDMKRLAQEQQLAAVPREVATVEARIAGERQAIEAAKAEWRELESRKKTLEAEIRSAEEKVEKYRGQQLQVRKNDEYQALTHEIESTTSEIGTLEEDEIRVLFSIDEARRKFAAAEAELRANIAGHEARIRTLQERGETLSAEHAATVATIAEARSQVPDPQLRLYDRLAAHPGLPVCVPISGGRCGGCHMKVSSNVEFESRRSEKITTCDQCGRVVYWQP